MKNIDCNVYKDFLPLYVDGIVSDETKEFVENHLLECEVCRKEVERLSRSVETPTEQSERVLEKIKKKLSMKDTLLRGMVLLLVAICLVMGFSENNTILRSIVEDEMNGVGVIDFDLVMYVLPLILGSFLMEWWLVNLKKMWWLGLIPLLWYVVLLSWAENLAAGEDFAAGIIGVILWMIGMPLLLGSCLAAFLKPKPIWENSKVLKFLIILLAIVIQMIGVGMIFWMIR